jgi:hypothetical protein
MTTKTHRFSINNFPTCLHRNANLKRINQSNFDDFYHNDKCIIRVRNYGGFSPDSRVEYIYLTFDNAKLLKTLGVNISIVPEKSVLLWTDEERKEFSNIEYLFNKVN